jgi:hypothetical protein
VYCTEKIISIFIIICLWMYIPIDLFFQFSVVAKQYNNIIVYQFYSVNWLWWVVSFTPRLLYPWRKGPRRLVEHHNQSGWCGEEKSLDPTNSKCSVIC